MTERPPDLSDESVRRALHDVADAVPPAPDLADRLLANARAGGPAVVRLSSRRHTRWAAPLLAAAAVAVLAVGGVALSSTLADRHTPTTTQLPGVVAPPSPSTPTSAAPSSPSATPRSTPHSTPRSSTGSTRTGSTTTGSTTTGTGRPALTAATLADARIDMPTWGGSTETSKCLGGERQFRNGRNELPSTSNSPNGAGQRYLEFQGAEAVGDVDGDGAADVTTVVYCGYNEPKGYRVLAFRASNGGGVEVLGDVTPALPFSTTEGRSGHPQSVRSGSPGEVVVRWAATQQPGSATQDRTYRYAAGRFTQVDGPTQFPGR